MLSLPDVPGVFCDAHLIDEGLPRFLSLWGRDTAMHEFLARLTIPEREGGLRAFDIGQGREPGASRVMALEEDRLSKITARRAGTLFGDLVQVWIYDRVAVAPDRANARALLLYREAPDQVRTQLWDLLKQTLWLPVLDSWDDFVISQSTQRQWLRPVEGYGVGAWLIDLSDRDAVDAAFGEWIRQGRLPVD